MVINNVGQVIGRQLVGTLEEHLIVEDITLHAHLPTNQVIDQHLLSGLNLEAHHILLTIGDQLLHLLLGKGQRVAHLTTRMAVVLEVLYLRTLGLQFLRGIEGNIGLSRIQQLLDIFLIDFSTLTLTIRPFVASKADTLIKLNAQPLERFDDIFLCPRYETCRIGIFYAEHKVALMLTGKQIIIQGSTHATNVQCPCWTRCETHPDSSF